MSRGTVAVAPATITSTLAYSGPPSGRWGDPVSLTAMLKQAGTGTPLSGRPVRFDLGTQSATGTTDAAGVASVSLTPAGLPGQSSLKVSYAGEPGYTAAEAVVSFDVLRAQAVVRYTGGAAVATGVAQQLSARLYGGASAHVRQAVTVLVGLMIAGCAGDGVTIYAPPQLAQASIFIDGKPSGHFQKTQRQYRWLGWKKMKEEVSAPPRSETIVKLAPVAAGTHELRIDKTGYEPIITTFTYSSGRLEIEIKDAQLKPTPSSEPSPTR